MGTLFVRQIALLMRKKMVKENSQGAKVDNFKFRIQLLSRKRKKNKKKTRHFISLPFILFPFVLYSLKADEPVVQSQILIHSSLILFSCFSRSYLSLRNKQPRRGGGGESLNTWVTCCYGQYLFSLFSFLSHF